MDASHIESRLRSLLAKNAEGIVAAYLFGSVAQGTARSTSDVDVGVLFEEAPPATLSSPASRLEGALERELGIRVQVVALNTAPVDLAIRVLRAECLLLDNDPSARIQFEVRVRNEYFDLEPHLRRYRKLEASA
jgi:predicted nucleotidyltransferase